MTQKIRIKSTPLFHMPGMVPFIANIQSGSFQRKAVPSRDELTRLWFITRSFPTMPSGAALAWATGEAKISTDGSTLVLEWDDGELTPEPPTNT